MIWLATSGLAIALAISLPSVAHTAAFRLLQEKHAAPSPTPPPQHVPTSQARAQSPGHARDWLRRYKDLAADEQERALQNDPEFRSLPPDRQQRLRQRLQHFSSLPPQQQLRMLNRMETWEHLTPAQKQQARRIFGQLRQLPPDRQRSVTTAVRHLRAMPSDQREAVINSDRFNGMFSDQERDLMRGATRLPLAPPDGAENGPQE